MKFSLKSKLISSYILLGAIPAILLALLIGWVSTTTSQHALEASAKEKLVALRSAKKSEIEAYFQRINDQVLTSSNNLMMVEAMSAFKEAFGNFRFDNRLGDVSPLEGKLQNFYTDQFQAKYNDRNEQPIDGKALAKSLSPDAIALQHEYIAVNPNPLGEKDGLNKGSDVSDYSTIHAKYHPYIREYLQKFGYYDIFLVDSKTGNIVYSVFKELDFATSLTSGPYANSGIAQAFNQANASNDPGYVALTDFAPYTPSYEDPAAFIASPVFENGEKTGVLIFQMPIDRINSIMTYGENWKDSGLGDSGETYLVGSDKKMRSQGRFLIDDKQGYLDLMKQTGASTELLNTIELKGTTIGLQVVDSVGSKKALTGESGLDIFPDYRNVPVVSAYAPLDIPGYNWAILSEVDEAEAFAAVPLMQREIGTWALGGLAIILLVACCVGFAFAKYIYNLFHGSISEVHAIAKAIERGDCDLTKKLDMGRNDVADMLSVAINTMTHSFADLLREVTGSAQQVAAASEKMSENTTKSKEGIMRQRSETEQVSTAMNEMTASAQEVSSNAVNGASIAREADQESSNGAQVVQATIREIESLANNVERAAEVVHELEKDSDSIGSVLDVIQGIAEQTNLLALNAAIEAARAGEQGRGFAVVADEVRSLASRTQESTQEIQAIIEQLQGRSKDAVKVMEDGRKQAQVGVEQAQVAGEALATIAAKVSEIDHVATQIATAAKEQGSVAEEINRNIVSISEVAEQNAESAEGYSQATDNLSSLSTSLQQRVANFKV